jgi:YhcH/YjgK/YiaL family protein
MMIMKRILAFWAAAMIVLSVSAQGVYTRQCGDKALQKKAVKWMKKGKWRNGFKAAGPHRTVNAVDFYEQYNKNTAQWESMFRWLAETDLLTIKKGKHSIEGTDLVVSVEDSENGPLEKRRSESHYHHIDFQYVVKGTERFGIIDHETSKPNTKYRPDVIHYAYDVDKARFYDSVPDEFFIFFPSDWHIAKVKTEKDDQNIRVIVVKLDYVE